MPPAGFRPQNIPIHLKNRLYSLRRLFSKTNICAKVYLVFYLKKNGDAVGSGVKNNALEAIFMNKG